MQKRPLKFSPATGALGPSVAEPKAYRANFPTVMWRFNPWTGWPRTDADVGSDPFGLLIWDGESPVEAETEKIGTGMPSAMWPCLRCGTSFAEARCPSCSTTDVTDVAAAREALHDAAEREQLVIDSAEEARVMTFGRPEPGPQAPPADHPLQDVFALAIKQATRGKGVRHGGEATPFLGQPWAHYGKMHGRGFLTGQAAKKIEEAASLRTGDAFITEALGAIVYIGMAILKEQGKV